MGRILYELNSHKNDDIDGNIHNIDYCNNNSMDVFNNNDKIDIYNPNIKTIFIKKIHGKC